MIYEKVYVETPVDTDQDGKLDLIEVYITRPKVSEKVPAIFVANPYMMTCNDDWYELYNVDKEVKVFDAQEISSEEIQYKATDKQKNITERITQGVVESNFTSKHSGLDCISDLYEHQNERGYASVFAGGLGTRGSEGITMTGSEEEVQAFEAVIHWLNGRTRAFTNKSDNIEVTANWCTGKVAMSAKSYLGTLAIGVATTGVDGLETIIPEAAISNWYDYYRYNGLTLPAYEWQGDDLDLLSKYCFSRAKDKEDFEMVKERFEKVQRNLEAGIERDSGNYNAFWDERNYLNNVDKIKASVFSIHGINDWNVKTSHCVKLFQELEKHNIDRKMLLHQGDHIYIYNMKESNCLNMIDRWLDYYLKGIENGIKEEPKVVVQSNTDQFKWYSSDEFPPKEAKEYSFPITKGEEIIEITDDLNSTAFDKEKKEGMLAWRDELILKDDIKHAAKFAWDPFENSDVKGYRISGGCKVSFKASIDKKTAIFSAMIVDVGEDSRLTLEQEVDENKEFAFKSEKDFSKYKIISRGWLNAQNRRNNYNKEEIFPNEFYDYSFAMVETDHTIKRGNKLMLVLYGVDADFTIRTTEITNIKIEKKSIDVRFSMAELN